MMVVMVACPDCGGETAYVRAGFKFRFPTFRLVADEVPSVRCQACGRTVPAPHVRPYLDAVVELGEEAPGATVRKDFAAVPLLPDEARA